MGAIYSHNLVCVRSTQNLNGGAIYSQAKCGCDLFIQLSMGAIYSHSLVCVRSTHKLGVGAIYSYGLVWVRSIRTA